MTDAGTLGGNAQGKVRSYVERALRLEEDKAAITADLGELYKEAKGDGFDAAALRKVVAREKDRRKTRQMDEMIALYEGAIQGELFEGGESGVTMTMRVSDGPESPPFTTADLERATEALR